MIRPAPYDLEHCHALLPAADDLAVST
jgi:hypothetical protein